MKKLDPLDDRELSEEEMDEAVRVLGICQCGNPVGVVNWVVDALRLIDKRHENWVEERTEAIERHFPDSTAMYFLAWHFLDRAGLIEHGSNIAGSWLTGEGADFLEHFASWGTGEG